MIVLLPLDLHHSTSCAWIFADAIPQLIGFHARSLLDDIAEHARREIYNIVEGIEGWATQIIRGESDEYQREVDTVGQWLNPNSNPNPKRQLSKTRRDFCWIADRLQGMHSLETLLESHVDKAFEKFTAWVMRNPFDIPAELEPVLVSIKTRQPDIRTDMILLTLFPALARGPRFLPGRTRRVAWRRRSSPIAS